VLGLGALYATTVVQLVLSTRGLATVKLSRYLYCGVCVCVCVCVCIARGLVTLSLSPPLLLATRRPPFLSRLQVTLDKGNEVEEMQALLDSFFDSFVSLGAAGMQRPDPQVNNNFLCK
jgi:hypothetical protein